MILSTHGFVASSIGQIDADALAFFARVDAATSTTDFLTTTEKTAINNLVISLKANGIWSKIKAAYPMVGGGTGTTAQRTAACSQNLKSSSFTGTFTATGWTFASTGVTPNGTSGYMDTTLIPSTNLTSGNNHASVYIRTNTAAGTKQELGSFNINYEEFSLIVRFTGDLSYPIIGGQFYPTYSNNNSQGFWTINRVNTTNIQYYNRATKVIDSPQTNGMSTRSIYVGARNNAGTADRFSDRECAFASIGDGLTNTEASNFYTAVQAFQTTLARQV